MAWLSRWPGWLHGYIQISACTSSSSLNPVILLSFFFFLRGGCVRLCIIFYSAAQYYTLLWRNSFTLLGKWKSSRFYMKSWLTHSFSYLLILGESKHLGKVGEDENLWKSLTDLRLSPPTHSVHLPNFISRNKIYVILMPLALSPLTVTELLIYFFVSLLGG